MPLLAAQTEFNATCARCQNLISEAFGTSASAVALSSDSLSQVVNAAFLNMFIGWEHFLETCFGELLIGSPTTSGVAPTRYAQPATRSDANAFMIGINRFFDYSNLDFVRKMAKLYFSGGYPFEPHVSAIAAEIGEMKVIRNATAHLSSTTQTALETVALRILGAPQIGITANQLLLRMDPRLGGADTVFAYYRERLKTTCQLIATG